MHTYISKYIKCREYKYKNVYLILNNYIKYYKYIWLAIFNIIYYKWTILYILMQKKRKVKSKSEMKLCISGLFFPYFPPNHGGPWFIPTLNNQLGSVFFPSCPALCRAVAPCLLECVWIFSDLSCIYSFNNAGWCKKKKPLWRSV